MSLGAAEFTSTSTGSARTVARRVEEAQKKTGMRKHDAIGLGREGKECPYFVDRDVSGYRFAMALLATRRDGNQEALLGQATSPHKGD